MNLYSKNDLKDSRIFFEKKMPPFVLIFVSFVAICLVVSIIISTNLVKPYIVKAQGIVTTSDNTYVSVQTNGYLLELHANEGQFVEKDDVLFTLSNGQEGIQDQAILEQINYQNSCVDAMNKYELSLNNRRNDMMNSGVEQEYYGKVEYYLSQINSENYTNSNSSNKLNEKVVNRQVIESEISNIKIKMESINDSVEKENLNADIENKESELTSLNEEIIQLQEGLNTPSSQAGQVYAQLISELGTSRSNANSKMFELQGQLKVAENQSNLMIVKATNDGYIHYLNPIRIGVSFQQNQTVAEISTNAETNLIVEAYIEIQDISKISVGNNVSVVLSGVNSQKYGTLKGTLVSVDTGTITKQTQQGDIPFYKCYISLQETTLKSNNGTSVKAIKSQPTEARIVYDKETYFEWVLEQLSFKN